MDPYIAESLTRWSVRLAIACYLARVLGEVGGVSIEERMAVWRRARWYWSVGCVLYLIHVTCAFGFFYQWSHQNAYQHTAIETAVVTGIHWGGGIYLNYLFTLFWISDVFLWWFYGIEFPYRSRGYFWTTHVVFAIMVVNATIVFGASYWLGIAGLVLILSGLRYWR